jgi:hypothetical protein
MADKPNILLLFVDQQRFDTIAGAGYKHMKTPAAYGPLISFEILRFRPYESIIKEFLRL